MAEQCIDSRQATEWLLRLYERALSLALRALESIDAERHDLGCLFNEVDQVARSLFGDQVACGNLWCSNSMDPETILKDVTDTLSRVPQTHIAKADLLIAEERISEGRMIAAKYPGLRFGHVFVGEGYLVLGNLHSGCRDFLGDPTMGFSTYLQRLGLTEQKFCESARQESMNGMHEFPQSRSLWRAFHLQFYESEFSSWERCGFIPQEGRLGDPTGYRSSR